MLAGHCSQRRLEDFAEDGVTATVVDSNSPEEMAKPLARQRDDAERLQLATAGRSSSDGSTGTSARRLEQLLIAYAADPGRFR